MVTILVIEDNPEVQEYIKEILELEEFNLLFAEDGRQGIEKAKQFLPDLILCDVMMPEMDGFDVLSSLQSHEATSNIPFIFLTAKADWKDFRRGMELGADDYLTKPFTLEELLKAIKTRLEKKAKTARQYTEKIQIISEEICRQIHFDPVTNLPNRLLLQEQFNRIRESVSPDSKRKILSVFCLSLDRFHQIQINLGYDGTEQLLKAFTERLKNSLDSTAGLACLGSGEFTIVFPAVEYKVSVMEMATLIKSKLTLPFIINNKEVFVTASIGISLYDKDGKEIEQLLQKAKKATHRVQENGGNNYDFYSLAFDVDTDRKQTLERDIRYAIARGELCVYYQPQVSLKTGKITGCEALLRWLHPAYNMLTPDIFIPITEEIGLIDQIGEWVLDRACKDLKKWQASGFIDLKMAVNISALQLRKANFRQKVINILLASQIWPKSLEFELTESSFLKNGTVAKQKIEALKSLDIRVSIDDFGSGYSSLKLLQNLPFDALKIDRTFIQNIEGNFGNSAITANLIKIAHSLGLTVVAEGVETAAELNVLKKYQCDTIQGYIFSYPVPALEFTELLKEGKCLKFEEIAAVDSRKKFALNEPVACEEAERATI